MANMAKSETIFSFGEIVNAKVRAWRLVQYNGKLLYFHPPVSLSSFWLIFYFVYHILLQKIQH